MSFPARLLNIFAIPGAVFEDIRLAPHSVVNWLGPIVLGAVVASLALWLTLCQPAVLQDLRTKQDESLSRLVNEGKIKAADAETTRKWIAWISRAEVARTLSAMAATTTSALRVFWWAFVVWLVGRLFFKCTFGYRKALEVVGLATTISVLGTLVALLLTVGFRGHSGAEPMAGMNAEMQSPLFVIVANVFNIWFVTLLALGLARLSGARLGQALFPILGFWLLFQMAIGLGMMSLGALAG